MAVRVFGPYRLVEPLGRGGMGEVWRAVDTSHDNRVVALKLLAGWLDNDSRFTRRFHREAALAASLGSPHVVPIHRYGEIEGRLYLDMQLVEGPDLADIIRRSGALRPARAVDLLAQAADGLDAAHRAGLVHRDVKPSNILVTATPSGSEHVYVIDFGIARAAESNSVSEDVVGTLAYMAPERFEGEGDQRCDVYALGCVLYEALTGTAAFAATNPYTLIKEHSEKEPPRPSAARPELPAALDAVVARALAKRPSDRYPTAPALAAAARAAITARPGFAAVPSQATPTRTAAPPGPVEPHSASGSTTVVMEHTDQQPLPPRRIPKALLVVLGVVVLAAAVVIPVALNADSSSGTTPPATSSSATSSTTSSSATTSASAEAKATAHPSLDARHQALFDDLADDGGVRWSSCTALATAEGTDVPTAIQCNTADPQLDLKVGFYRLAGSAVYDARLASYRKQIKRSGRCRDGNESAGDWTSGGGATRKGFIACLDNTARGNFVIRWASPRTLIEGRVEDAGRDTAYAWWTEHASSVPA